MHLNRAFSAFGDCFPITAKGWQNFTTLLS
jgi:hypothetical protein